MRVWWEARTRREQVLLLVLGVIVVAVLYLFGGYRPVAEARREARLRYDRAIQDGAEVTGIARRVRAMGAAAAPSDTGAPVAEVVNTSAASAGITLARVEPDPAGGVRVTVNAIAPTTVFPWLAAMQKTQGITPRHLTVVKDDQGALSLDATLDRAGG